MDLSICLNYSAVSPNLYSMFTMNIHQKVLSISLGALIVLCSSIHLPAYAQSVIQKLSVDDPAGLVLDLKGNAYIVETGKNRILEFSSNGTLIRTWGSSGSGPGQFQTPIGIDEDESKQNVYITDVGNNRVDRFSSNGLFVAQWGGLGSGPGQFANPGRVAVDPAGNVYVADFGQPYSKV